LPHKSYTFNAGDGETNGQELGDPCCVWTAEGEPSAASRMPTHADTPLNATYDEMVSRVRKTRLSDPADFQSISGTTPPNKYQPPCTALSGGGDSEIELDVIEIMKAVKPGPTPATLGEQLSTVLLAAMAVQLVTCFGTIDDTLNLPWHVLVGLMVFVLVWTDFVGGCTHIVLDNPAVRSWPLIGNSAKMFQHHHGNSIIPTCNTT
jgi:hypothetical protein